MHRGRVAFGADTVLDGVDFHLDPSEFVVLLGENGSGKTTLIKALLGLIPLTEGRVEAFGVPLSRVKERRRIGYVPQRPSATSGVPASVLEVVLSGRAGHAGVVGRYGKRDRELASSALAAVDLEHEAASPVSILSGGQQQRVLIARALAGEPDVLLLDEPVASVDLAHQESLADNFARLNARGTAILLVAHAQGAMGALAHRSVVMQRGRIVYDGPPFPDPHPGEHHPHERGEGLERDRGR